MKGKGGGGERRGRISPPFLFFYMYLKGCCNILNNLNDTCEAVTGLCIICKSVHFAWLVFLARCRTPTREFVSTFVDVKALFNWVSKVIRVLIWFYFTSLCDWLKRLAPLSSQMRTLKPIPTCPHAFSRAWRRLHAFASSSDWFIG